MRDSTTAFLLICLAVTDTISLYMGALDDWIKSLTDWSASSDSDVSCKVYTYFYYTFSTLSAWQLLLITYERITMLEKPLEVHLICTKKTLGGAMLIILLVICLSTGLQKLVSGLKWAKTG